MADKGVTISFGVETSGLDKARESAKELSDTLRTMGKGMEAGDDFDRWADVFGQMKEDVRELQGLATAMRRQGGLLDKNQLKEVADLSWVIKENFNDYEGALAKAEEKLQNFKDLLGDSDWVKNNPLEYTNIMGWMPEAEAEVNRLRGYGDLEEKLSRRAESASGLLAGAGEKPDEGMGAAAGMLKGGAKMALAYLGLQSMMGLVRDTEQEARAVQETEKYLKIPSIGEGYKSFSDYEKYSIKPLEYMMLKKELGQGAGFVGKDADRLALLAAKISQATGQEYSSVAGFMTSAAPSVGFNATAVEKLTLALYKAGEQSGSAMAMLGQIMTQSTNILEGIHARRGLLTEDEAQRVIELQSAVWEVKGGRGQGRAGEQAIEQLDTAIQAGGQSDAQKMLFWNAWARKHGDKGRPAKLTASNWVKFQEELEMGAAGEMDELTFQYVKELYGSGDLARIALKSMWGQASFGKEGILREVYEPTGSPKRLDATKGELAEEAARMKKRIKIQEIKANEARLSQAQVDVGSTYTGIGPAIKRALLRIAGADDGIESQDSSVLNPMERENEDQAEERRFRREVQITVTPEARKLIDFMEKNKTSRGWEE